MPSWVPLTPSSQKAQAGKFTQDLSLLKRPTGNICMEETKVQTDTFVFFAIMRPWEPVWPWKLPQNSPFANVQENSACAWKTSSLPSSLWEELSTVSPHTAPLPQISNQLKTRWYIPMDLEILRHQVVIHNLQTHQGRTADWSPLCPILSKSFWLVTLKISSHIPSTNPVFLT